MFRLYIKCLKKDGPQAGSHIACEYEKQTKKVDTNNILLENSVHILQFQKNIVNNLKTIFLRQMLDTIEVVL